MTALSLLDLATQIREEAVVLRRWSAVEQAAAAEVAADRIEAALAEWESASLTVAEAAAESGYSHAHLSRLIAEGRLDNQGSKGRPRIRRRDLPKKLSTRRTGEPDLVGEVLLARQQRGL